MRCLYCGKELALLKRWTGGGEFCSDAHRQRYQEEYNQLALNRLLQAQPAETSTLLKSDTIGKTRPPETKPKVDVAPRPELRPESRPDARLESRNVEPRHGDSNGVAPNQASTNAAETVPVACAIAKRVRASGDWRFATSCAGFPWSNWICAGRARPAWTAPNKRCRCNLGRRRPKGLARRTGRSRRVSSRCRESSWANWLG